MSTSINKNGVWYADGSDINPNLVTSLTGSAYGSGERSELSWCNLSGGNGTNTIVRDESAPVGNYICRITGNTSGNKDAAQYDTSNPYKLSGKYTMSAFYRGYGTSLLRIWNRTTGKQSVYKALSFNTNGMWQLVTYTFDAPSDANGTNVIGFLFGITGSSEADICGMKVEEGSIATPWIPNESDEIYILNTQGFNEGRQIASVSKGSLNGNSFIEL